MDNYDEENQLELLTFIEETIKYAKDLKQDTDLQILRDVASSLRLLAKKLDQYTSNKKRQQLLNDLSTLYDEIKEYQSKETVTSKEILCKLIKANLPDQINAIITSDNKLELKTTSTKNPVPIGSIHITGDPQIIVTVEFVEKPAIDKRFELPDLKSIYSVINYVNLALGYSQTL